MIECTIRRSGSSGTTRTEVLFHRVASGKQPDGLEAGGADRIGGRVRNVHERSLDRRDDRVGDLVHGVRAQHEQLGAGGHQRRSLGCEESARLLPVAAALELLDRDEVDRSQQAVGRVQAAQPFARASFISR
jgi:hypothetical protein